MNKVKEQEKCLAYSLNTGKFIQINKTNRSVRQIVKEKFSNTFYVSFKTGSKRTSCVVYGMMLVQKWVKNLPIFRISINTFLILKRKRESCYYHFAPLPFLPRRGFLQILVLVSGSKYVLEVDGHLLVQIVRSRSFNNCNSTKHFLQTPFSVHCSQPLPHSKREKAWN